MDGERNGTLNDRIPDGTQTDEIERALCAIQGMEACKLVVDKNLRVLELHGLAPTSRSPKQLVRDIQATLATRFGIRLDYRKIGIAQLRDESGQGEELLSLHRLKIKRISVLMDMNDLTAEASVILELGSRSYEGSAKGPGHRMNILRLVALATLLAAEEFLRSSVRFVLDDIRELHLSGREGFLVSIVAVAHSGEFSLVGGALLRDTEIQSIARATMDALNRYFLPVKVS